MLLAPLFVCLFFCCSFKKTKSLIPVMLTSHRSLNISTPTITTFFVLFSWIFSSLFRLTFWFYSTVVNLIPLYQLDGPSYRKRKSCLLLLLRMHSSGWSFIECWHTYIMSLQLPRGKCGHKIATKGKRGHREGEGRLYWNSRTKSSRRRWETNATA